MIEEMQKLSIGTMTLAFGDIAGHRNCCSANLAREPVKFVFGKVFGVAIDLTD